MTTLSIKRVLDMPVSSRVVSRTPRSSSAESSRSQASRSQASHGKRAQTEKISVSAPNKLAPTSVTRKTKSLPAPLAPASPPKNIRAKTPVAAKSTVKTPVAKRLAIAADAASDTSIPKASNFDAPKVKRTRVPADLAERYGENRKERKVAEPSTVAQKKARKTAEQREKLRQLMTPDDDILQRLARAAAGSSRPAPRQKKATRSKAEWESRCGKCGVTAVFSTPAALCMKCGAITVRVLD